jgi:hypothetical protein
VQFERPQGVWPFDSFPAFYGTRRFITEFTRDLHLSSFCYTNPVHTISFCFSMIHLNEYLPTCVLVFLSGLYLLAFPTNKLVKITNHEASCYAAVFTLPSFHSSSFQILSSAPWLQPHSVYVHPLISEIKSTPIQYHKRNYSLI